MEPAFEHEIRERAYAFWVAGGMAEGDAERHWLHAEAAVRREMPETAKPAAVVKKAKPVAARTAKAEESSAKSAKTSSDKTGAGKTGAGKTGAAKKALSKATRATSVKAGAGVGTKSAEAML